MEEEIFRQRVWESGEGDGCGAGEMASLGGLMDEGTGCGVMGRG